MENQSAEKIMFVKIISLDMSRYAYAVNNISKSVSIYDHSITATFAFVVFLLRYGVIFWVNSLDVSKSSCVTKVLYS